MDYDSLPLTRFCYFVAPEPLPFQGSKRFDRFMDLPLEIHRIIFRHCDAPTPFYLMHTSSYVRYECLELFWHADHSTLYLFEHPHKMFGHKDKVCPIHHCPRFAYCITQVEIGLSFLDHDLMARCGSAFWDNLQELFPSVRNVVLSGNTLQLMSSPPPLGEYDEEYSRISDFVMLAPPNITPFVAFKYGDDAVPYHRS